ncbi:MAG: FGGY family carbohydrate kinase [Flavobacteriaceae bacterium]|nr:FGGY family carbohydrate kinase [Flavobacteriaceae bacterium]
MKKVVAIFDIGKTNKKLFLFDENFEVVFKNSTRFDETVDDDNDPCDDIASIENWIKNQIKKIQKQRIYTIKAINFSTHGATLVYLDKEGNRITPLYNYLKPLDHVDFSAFYENHGSVEEFSRKTASPAYGMLNSGLQMYWLKHFKPNYWNKTETILHYPQYLSFLFTKKVRADFTSIGAHTATWDFDRMNYHNWLSEEHISLPKPTNGKEATFANVNGEQIAIGSGLHDSSASIIPLLKNNDGNAFILLSTGTWIISMNPFSKETLTQHQLSNNCLCFMTPDKQQIKSSMQFLGRIHEVYLEALSKHFKADTEAHLNLDLDKNLCDKIVSSDSRVFLAKGIDTHFEAKPELLDIFDSYEKAYYQLVFEISKKVNTAIDLILDKNSKLKDIYISGGFNRNEIFVQFLKLLKPDVSIKIPKAENESALGAAVLMKDYL